MKIGIIGAGGIVRQRHMPGLRQFPEVQIAAVANATLASAQAFCREMAPEARPMNDWRDLIELPELDAVWIGATPQLHEPATVATLAAGKHVFCQARMARNLAEAKHMLEASLARPDRVAMLCPPPHGLRADLFIKELLAENIIGTLQEVRLQSLNGQFLDPAKPAHWRQRREISGKNVLTLGIHTEILQRWLGAFTPQRATGHILTPVREGYRIEIPDSLDVEVKFSAGFAGHLSFSGIHSDAPVERVALIGTEGILTYDYLNEKIHLRRPPETQARELEVPTHLVRGWQVEADFIHAVQNPHHPQPHPDFTDGLNYMQVVEAVDALLVSAKG